MIIRPMHPTDLDAVVAVHMESFSGFFLTFLGPRFLALLYRQLAADGVLLVACSDDRVVGFVGGVLRQSGFYRRLVRQHWWGFGWAAVGAALRRPAIVPRLLRALRRPAEAERSAAEACLMSIAVRPAVAGQGIGRQLVRAFCAELSARGAPAVCLTTDRDGNERTHRFYQQLGFQPASTFVTPEGRAMIEYVIALPPKD